MIFFRLDLILTLAISFFVAFYTTPVARDAARRFGIMDNPDGGLKRQPSSTPYFGGLAIYLSFLVGISTVYEFNAQILGILLGGSIIVVVGLIDDLGTISPGAKLAGEVIAIFVLVKSGIKLDIVFIPETIQLFFTFVWMVLMINAFNLIDVMDGLSAGVALIGSLFLCAVSIINGNIPIAILSISLVGALLGFIPYNYHPASIYMGDCGSLLIGFLLGAFSMIGRYTSHNRIAFVVPAIILGVPLFETFFVSYIRFRRGKPIMKGSRDHFALRLRKWRLNTRQTVAVSYMVSIICGFFGISIMMGRTGVALASLVIFFLMLILTGIWLKKIDMTM